MTADLDNAFVALSGLWADSYPVAGQMLVLRMTAPQHIARARAGARC